LIYNLPNSLSFPKYFNHNLWLSNLNYIHFLVKQENEIDHNKHQSLGKRYINNWAINYIDWMIRYTSLAIAR